MKSHDKELLDLVSGYFDNLNLNYEKDLIGDTQALVIKYTVDSEILPEDCTITINHPDNNCTAVQFLFTVFSGLDERTAADISDFFVQMNSLLSLGNFGALTEDGFIYFSYAFLTDKLKEENILLTLDALFGILTLTAAKGRALLLPLILGNVTKKELSSEDLSIVQD